MNNMFSNKALRKLIVPLVIEQTLVMLVRIVFHMGIIGVWIAMGMDWLARSVAFAFRYKREKWRKIQVI